MRRPPAVQRTSVGQALAEFAIVLPIALLLLLAIFDMGRAVFIYNGLTNAAREGSRLAIVNQDEALIGQRVQATTFAGAVSNVADPSLVQYHKSLPNKDALTNPQCSPVVVGCIAVVRPQVSWTPITPVIGSIIGPITFEARSELPIEFLCPNAAIAAYQVSSSCPKQP